MNTLPAVGNIELPKRPELEVPTAIYYGGGCRLPFQTIKIAYKNMKILCRPI